MGELQIESEHYCQQCDNTFVRPGTGNLLNEMLRALMFVGLSQKIRACIRHCICYFLVRLGMCCTRHFYDATMSGTDCATKLRFQEGRLSAINAVAKRCRFTK